MSEPETDDSKIQNLLQSVRQDRRYSWESALKKTDSVDFLFFGAKWIRATPQR